MNAIYDSHIIKWQNVRWGQDGQRLLETLKTCRGSQVITRVKQSGRMIEVAHPVEDLAGRLRQGHVNLQQSFDVELITREPAWMETAGKPPVAMEEKFVDRHDENQLQWNGERGTGCLAAGSDGGNCFRDGDNCLDEPSLCLKTVGKPLISKKRRFKAGKALVRQ